jgi:uncharacterized membrane protein
MSLPSSPLFTPLRKGNNQIVVILFYIIFGWPLSGLYMKKKRNPPSGHHMVSRSPKLNIFFSLKNPVVIRLFNFE